MPFQASFEIQGAKEWGFYEPETRFIQDSFNRPSGVLGISTNGQTWNILAGSWYVNNNYQAETDTAVTSGTGPYPMASFDLVDVNQLGYANVSPGMGFAFNIKDANNWYAVAGYDSYSTYSCGCSTCCSCCSCTYGCTTGTSCAECGSYCLSCVWCSPQPCPASPSCTYCGSACNSCTYGCTTGANCSVCGSNCNCVSCGCSTCYSYYYYLTVLQSVNGTVSTLSTTALTQDAVSISVEVNNGTVAYYAYSTNITGTITQPYGLGTLLTSGTLSISGPFGTQAGMVKTPSYYSQGTTISGFYATGL